MNQAQLDAILQCLTDKQISNIFWHIKGYIGVDNRELLNKAIISALEENKIITEQKQYIING